MRHFHYKNGQMWAEDVPLSDIAAAIGTPCYVYSAATFTRHYNVFAQAMAGFDNLIAYSVKANSNLAVLSLLAKLGSGADVVSGGELVRALRAGIPPEKIVFSGVGKTVDELRLALKSNIGIFNVESLGELAALNATATDMGKTARIAFRINPDISAGGHEKISTGKAENKFGIAINDCEAAYTQARDMTAIDAVGVDMHIGSQITDLTPFRLAMQKGLDLIDRLRAAGHDIRSFDIGGGLGIAYENEDGYGALPQEYGAMIADMVRGRDIKMIFEPGRIIAGNAGVLLSKVIYNKSEAGRQFLIVDAAMNDLIRPALYNAHHEIEPVIEPSAQAQTSSYDVVGPVCETGDTFGRDRALPPIKDGELLVFHSGGAYGAVQASQYNTRPLVPEVLVSGDKYAVIRKRPSVEDILAQDVIPDWV